MSSFWQCIWDCYSEKEAGIVFMYSVIFFTPVTAFVPHTIIKEEKVQGKKRFRDAWSLLATFYETEEENGQIYIKKKSSLIFN